MIGPKNQSKLPPLLLLCLLAPTPGGALTLGDVSVRSHLLETLRAEVPILAADADEIADLKLRVAGQRDFERFGIARLPLHDQLRFEVRERAGQWLVEIVSTAPVREPYVSIPVQALWRNGQMVREYTLLLDPRPARRAPAAAARRSSPVAAAAPAPVAPALQEYGPVRPGETLWPIAQRVKPAGVSTEQMMMALLRANPEAFTGGNVNGLQAGRVLRIPAMTEIQALGADQARRAFRDQTAAWGGVATPAAADTPPEPAAASGADGEDASQLRILARNAAESAAAVDPASAAEQRMLLSLEQAAAERLELESLRVQVEQLEEQMAQMRRLLELKDRQVAALERSQAPAGAALDQTDPGRPAAAPPPAVATAAPPSLQAAPTPAMVVVPDRVGSPAAPTTWWGSWWVWAAAAMLGLLALALLAVWGRRRGTPGDLVLGQNPAVAGAPRPYAEQVARIGTQRSAAAPAAGGVGMPHIGVAETEHHDAAAAPAAHRQTLPPEHQDRPLQELAGDMPPAAEVSDAELEAWVRDLADDGDDLVLGEGEPLEVVSELASGDDELDLSLPLDAATPTKPDGQVLQGLEIDSALSADQDDDELALKLELAKAYMEVGDGEGARELLQQLVEDSLSGPEREEARRLLSRLG